MDCLMDFSTVDQHYPTFKHLNLSLNELNTCTYVKTFLNLTNPNPNITSLFTPTFEHLKSTYPDLFHGISHEKFYNFNSKLNHNPTLMPSDLVMEINISVNKEVNKKDGTILTGSNDSFKLQATSSSAAAVDEQQASNHSDQTTAESESNCSINYTFH